MIKVDALTKEFGNGRAVSDLSFRASAGDIVGLLGPNGAGKTTCMRILAGYLRATSGTVEVAGFDIRRDALQAQARMGYLPEGAPLYPELRVAEYLAYRARLRRIRRARRKSLVADVMERCGVTSVGRRLIGELSRGYRQRVGLADALLGDPEVLVLDEPTAGLDPNQIRQVRALISSLGGKRTVLLSSHILSEIEAVCNRVLIMDRGSLVAQGPVQEVCRGREGVVIRLRAAIDAVKQTLGELSGVESVVVALLQEGDPPLLQCEVLGELDAAAREQIAVTIMQSGWALQEMRDAKVDLEHVFAQLTDQQQHPEPVGGDQ